MKFYHPLPTLVKGDQIILNTNFKTIITNEVNPKLDSEILVSKNSIGFRGPNLPKHLEDHYSIITVGGSTTECLYSNDDKTWTHLLNKRLAKDIDDLWVNNAGLSGHSTFGHIIFMKDHIIDLNPDMVLFLVGVNDLARSSQGPFKSKKAEPGKGWFRSEIYTLIFNLYSAQKAKVAAISYDKAFNLMQQPDIIIDSVERTEQIESHDFYLILYENRLLELITICQGNNIEPVFLTQPALFGDLMDPTTGVDLGTIRWGELDGSTGWQVLELYNELVRKVCEENEIALIDLAKLLPKDSKYFWDLLHYTNEGNEKVAEVVGEKLLKLISD